MKEKGDSIYTRKNCILSGIVSLLFTYSLFFGFLCHNDMYSFNVLYPFAWIAIWGISFFLIINSWNLIDKVKTNSEKKQEEIKKERKTVNSILLFCLTFVILFLAWLPCFIAAYPGFFTYDMGGEFVQIFYKEVPVNAVYPLVHSVLMWFCLKVGFRLFQDYNVGIAMFSIIHMLACAVSFAYETVFVYKITRKISTAIISIVYFSITPVIVIFSPCTNSTVIGTALIVLLIIKYYEIFIQEKYKNKIRLAFELCLFVFVAVLACNTRHSFAALIAIIILLQFFKKEKLLKRTIFLLCVLALTFIFNAGISKAFNAVKTESTEFISIPIQQLASLYVKEGDSAFTADEKKVLLDYYADEHFKWFCPQNVDPIKIGMNKKLVESEPGDFYRLWAKKGIQHPLAYLEAWNYFTYEAWYPFCVPDGYVKRNYVTSNSRTDYYNVSLDLPAQHENRFPWLFEKIKWLSTQADVYKIPLLGWLSTIGYQYIFLVYVLGYKIFSKDKQMRFILFVSILYYLVMLLATIVVVRYYLLLFYSFPIVIGSMFCNTKSES